MKRKIVLSEQQIINAIRKIIGEARRNPETNIDGDFTSFYNRMINKYPIEDMFISFRDTMDVTDVNPKNKYRTPTGFYTYPLSSFSIPEDPSEKEFRKEFPFASDKKFINFFILKTHDGILASGTDKSILNGYAERIKELYPNVNEVKELCNSFIDGGYSSSYRDDVFHDTHLFWLLLYDVSKIVQVSDVQTRINLICRNIGVNGFIDYEGSQFIHKAEPKQAVFFKVKNIGDVFIYEKPKADHNSIKRAIQNGQYDIVKGLEGGVKVIKLFDVYGMINRDGELITKQLFSYIGGFKDGYASVILNNKWNHIRQNGELLSPKHWFDGTYVFINGLAKVKLDGRWNFINENGELISKQWFDWITGSEGGYSKVTLNRKENYMRQNGEIVSKQWFDFVHGFRDGFAPVNSDEKWNFINENGELLSPNMWFDFVARFENGFAPVELDDRWNYINQNGDLLSPKQWFDNVYDVLNGVAKVILKNKKYEIDIKTKSMVEI